MLLVYLVFASQILDGVTFAFVFGRGQELNPVMSQMAEYYGLIGVLLAKFGLAVILFIAALPLRHRRKLLLGVTIAGIVGAYSNLLGLL
jgi:hypothetical protein